MSGDRRRSLRSALLRWYRRNRRDLPWRRTGDPYAIWVSEIMLQQTRVETVLPYYARFLERFPDASRLACATEDEVLASWSGLGYYRRARALHQGARTLMEHHGGKLPRDPSELRRLPGVGRYTAGAIASVAFDLPEPILDGNVRRVLARIFAVDGSKLGPAAEERELWKLAGALVRGATPGDLNQALMELGALVCTPRAPDCGACPARERCRVTGDDPERYPAARPRPDVQNLRVAVALVRRSGRLLLERPQRSASPLRGRWDLPAVELPGDGKTAPTIHETLLRRHGLEVTTGPYLGHAMHGIMNRRLRLEAVACRLLRGRVAGRDELRWLEPDELDEVPVSGATRKLLRIGAQKRDS